MFEIFLKSLESNLEYAFANLLVRIEIVGLTS